MYIFQVSGRYTSRPDSRHHATSGCHTRGIWRSLHPDPLAYTECSPDYHQKFKYPARLFAKTLKKYTPHEYIRTLAIILKIKWCRLMPGRLGGGGGFAYPYISIQIYWNIAILPENRLKIIIIKIPHNNPLGGWRDEPKILTRGDGGMEGIPPRPGTAMLMDVTHKRAIGKQEG